MCVCVENTTCTQLNNGGWMLFLFRSPLLLGLLKWVLIPTVCRAGGEELLLALPLEGQSPPFTKSIHVGSVWSVLQKWENGKDVPTGEGFHNLVTTDILGLITLDWGGGGEDVLCIVGC